MRQGRLLGGLHESTDGGGPVDEGVNAEGDGRSATIYDLQPDPQARVNLRRLPRLSRNAMRILWRAARRDFLLSTGMQLIGGLGITVQLLLGQRALQALLGATRGSGSVADVLPWAVAVALVAAMLFFATAVQRERQQILGELVSRHIEERVLDVAAAVGLEAFESPAFHNRLQRVRTASHQPLNLVFGLSGLAWAVVGVAGVVVALLALQPLLIPLLVLVFLPAWLVASRRSEAFYRFLWRMTPRDRERQYVAGLLSDRDAAKEVRGFGLAGYLRARYEHLYDERLGELRQIARRQLLYSLGANLATGAVLGATLLLVTWLTLSGRVALAQAGVAVAGVALAGSRLAQAGYASGSLSEAALYLDDYVAFLDLLPQAVAARPTAEAPRGFERLRVDGVSFTYPSGAQAALRDVSMEITNGEVVALVGENGSGKTTLAKLLAGLYAPDQGHIRWDGTDTATVDPEQLRRSVAVIFQDFLHYHLPARDRTTSGSVGTRPSATSKPSSAPPTTPTPTGSSPRSGPGTRPCSVRSSSAAPICRSGSGSAWRSPEPSSAMRPSSSSTSPPRPSTRERSTTSSNGSAPCSATAPCC